MAKSAPAKKAAPKAAPKRTSLIADPRESAAPAQDPAKVESAADKQQVDDGTDTILPRRSTAGKVKDGVLVTVVKAFRLTDQAGEHKYAVGTYPMPREHAEHWYAQAHLGSEADDE